ncbi:GIY-YIG nuclease family protein [Arthrobacter pigmenti]
MVEHFGERIRLGKYGYRLTRESYAMPNKAASIRPPREVFSDTQWADLAWAYEDDNHTRLSDKFCQLQREAALENFDLNMAFFAQVPPASFEEALNDIQREVRSLRPIDDLRSLDGAGGIYVMVLDEYRQAYIGQATDIRARIKKHWSGTKQFDRLLWGDKHESVLSIDSFRPLDTTRIFAMRTSRPHRLEAKLVEGFPPDYLLNRIGGGRMVGMRPLFIAEEIKRRQLTDNKGSQPPVATNEGESKASLSR